MTTPADHHGDLPAATSAFVDHADRAALYVDFDGTLAPIVVDPQAARPLPAARDALARLARVVSQLTVISGRPVAFLRDAVGVEGVRLVGQYGAERQVGDGTVVDERMVAYVGPLQRAADEAEAALPGLLVERKGLGVTLHWRAAPDRESEAMVEAVRLAREHGFALAPGRMAIELRPPVAMDKGLAVETDLDGGTYLVGMCIGDDIGDVAMFDALDRLVKRGALSAAIRVGVRSAEGPAEIVERADVVVDGPLGVTTLLAGLADRIAMSV